MHHIVIDLEFDRIDKSFRRAGMLTYFEIIEIGAVKLDENYTVIDRFQSFVRPSYIIDITKPVKKLTGINTSDLTDAPKLEEAIKTFSDWAYADGNFDIYAWSENDEYQWTDETEMKSISDPLCTAQWIDLQKIFNDSVGLDRDVSLKNALDWLNIDLEGREHRASDDAFNTASVLRILSDEEQREERVTPIKKLFISEGNHSSTLSDVLGFNLTELCFACAI